MAASIPSTSSETDTNLLVDVKEPIRIPSTRSEREINFLVDLKEDSSDKPLKRKKLVAQEALAEWKESLEELEGKLSRRTKRVDCLTNEIYQLVGLYSVFVGVVFSAVQSDRVQCQHVWSPIVLCLLPCFIIVRFIDKKLLDIQRIREEIALDERSRKILKKYRGSLKAKGFLDFDFGVETKERVLDPKEEKHHESITKPGVVGILLLSSAVLVGSFLHILCFTKSPSCEGCVRWNDYAPGHILPY